MFATIDAPLSKTTESSFSLLLTISSQQQIVTVGTIIFQNNESSVSSIIEPHPPKQEQLFTIDAKFSMSYERSD